MVTGIMLEKEKRVLYSSFLSPNPTRNKFDEIVGLKFLKKLFFVVITFLNQKIKFDLSKIEKTFYQSP